MKHTYLIFGALVTVLLMNPFQAFAEDGSSIETVYRESCAACHGDDGKGAFEGIPDFTDPDGRLSKDDLTLLKHILEGFESEGSAMAMPAKGGNEDITEEDIKELLAYIRSHFGAEK